MTPRQRLLTLLDGRRPDCVPWYADLSHWFVVRRGERFVPTVSGERDLAMVESHRDLGVGLYLNMGAFYDTVYDAGDVTETTTVEGDEFLWTIRTPVGTVREVRRWSQVSFSWDITHRMIQGLEDVETVAYAMRARRYVARYERYHEWREHLGEIGEPFAAGGYCGLGFLISRFMGVIETIYALHDHPSEMGALIDTINKTQLQLVDVLAGSPSAVVFWSDNLDAATQPPPLFNQHSAYFYREMARRAHDNGKVLAVHIDGRMHGLLQLLADCGVDIADAVTPMPMGDLSPAQCREQAGNEMILWGGVSPDLWEPRSSDAEFDDAVKRWLDLRLTSDRLVLGPGDQVPPGAPLDRIQRAGELAQTYGRY